MTYDTPEALRMAIEARIGNISDETGIVARQAPPPVDFPACRRASAGRRARPVGGEGWDGYGDAIG